MSISFRDLSLSQELLDAVDALGFKQPTPIQEKAIPVLLGGADLVGESQTGSGKTAAFSLPILQKIDVGSRDPQALILCPTRELVAQVVGDFRRLGRNRPGLRVLSLVGGEPARPQAEALERGPHVVVGTPGRILDHLARGRLTTDSISTLVLDEADRMLDMGFVNDVRKVIAMLPKHRQNLFFSATMPNDIQKLADSMLTQPVRVEVTPVSSTAERIEQSLMYVDRKKKPDLLRFVLKDPGFKRVIIFTRTKHGANRVSETLAKNGISSAAIHGNKSQGARQRALEDFRLGRIRTLVATDIAARGIDIDEVTHVINYEIPNIAESYVHRIGRTARAGADGRALSFCDAEERSFIRDIEKVIAQAIPVQVDHPYHSEEAANSRLVSKGKAKAAIEGRREDNRGGQRGPRRRRRR